MIIDTEVAIKEWRVKSKSQPDLYRTVAVSNKGNWFCDCPAGGFRHICKHIKLAQKHYGTQQQNN
jgi:uncharacterized Zn finger protein